MSEQFSKEWYLENKGKKVKVGNRSVYVKTHRTESRGGSWERGFRFYHTVWALLVWDQSRKPFAVEYSTDHGKTWHKSIKEAMKSKGKMKLESSNHGEFAFDAIQDLNRKYDGPGYQWKR